ncbi:hypothetical protein CRYUN_Cryun17cG0144900 [Craigia yunnanensis]
MFFKKKEPGPISSIRKINGTVTEPWFQGIAGITDEEGKVITGTGKKININTSIEAEAVALKEDCRVACQGRCKLSKRPNLCKRACGSCCAKCNCVPPGTAGNHEHCPCYANLTTRNKIHKCP